MIKFNIDIAEARAEVEGFRKKGIVATERALERMGDYVEGRARIRARRQTGELANKIYSEGYATPDGYVILVGSDAPYSLYVEQGFTGHFVPFHIAEDLYRTAMTRWGWRVPTPSELPKNANTSFRYLIPKGRSSPVWGVFIPGQAHPFLRPALRDLRSSHVDMRILREEFKREFGA